MFGFIANIWKKRKVNRTQSAVLGDCDETLMCLPSDTAAWVVAKFNELTATVQEKDAELSMARRRILALSAGLDKVVDAARPYVVDVGIARRIFNIASEAVKV